MMEAPLPGASRFHVVFGRSSGSRKQRAKREGSLSVGYHTASLFDTEEKTCVMVCKGTGVTPNKIFSRMQAARRGAGWTIGTELALNGYDVVIEEVMELHLIPYDQPVQPALPESSISSAGSGKDTAAFSQRSTGLSTKAQHLLSVTENKRDGGPAFAPYVKTAVPTPTAAARLHDASTASFLFGREQMERAAIEQHQHPQGAFLDSATDAAKQKGAFITTPIYSGAANIDTVCATKRGRESSIVSTSLSGDEQPRRRRRSAASIERELRSGYPQYF